MKAALCRRSHGRPCASTSSAEPEARVMDSELPRYGRGTGAPRAVSSLELEDLRHIARRTLGEVEVRDMGLLASAAARPQAWGTTRTRPSWTGPQRCCTPLPGPRAGRRRQAPGPCRRAGLPGSERRAANARQRRRLRPGHGRGVWRARRRARDRGPARVATEPWTVDGRAVDGTASADPPSGPVAATGSSRTPAAGRAASGRARGGPGCRRRRTSGATGRRWR